MVKLVNTELSKSSDFMSYRFESDQRQKELIKQISFYKKLKNLVFERRSLKKASLYVFFQFQFIIKLSGYCIVVVPLPSKQEVRVRFPLSAWPLSNLKTLFLEKIWDTNKFLLGTNLADVAKWLRQWIVTPLFAGSTPVIRH